jgi:hypothetical protein
VDNNISQSKREFVEPSVPEGKPFPRPEILFAVGFHQKPIEVVTSAAMIIYLISQIKK